MYSLIKYTAILLTYEDIGLMIYKMYSMIVRYQLDRIIEHTPYGCPGWYHTLKINSKPKNKIAKQRCSRCHRRRCWQRSIIIDGRSTQVYCHRCFKEKYAVLYDVNYRISLDYYCWLKGC